MRDLTTLELLAENVRGLRTERGISQEQLGDRAGLHRTYVGAVERAERNISLRSLERLALALEVRPAALISDPTSGG